jgi:uncharacterized membrane-anchored protein YhcB (DUF1043 family)
MTPFAADQLIILALSFVLGLLIGMFVMAGGRWKRAYREQARRSEELETENNRLQRDAREMDSLRHAAARNERRDLPPEPDPARA